MHYRVSFFLEAAGITLVTLLEYASLALVFNRFGTLQGWTLSQVAFLYGLAEFSFGIMDMVFSGFDPGHFGLRVRQGTFDQFLLRPVNITLQVFSSEFVLRRLGKIIIGIAILISAIKTADITWTIIKIALTCMVVFSQVLFFGGLFIIGATITFWTVESIEMVNILTYGGSYMISHPMHIYPKPLRHFFTFVIPAIFLNYYPALHIFEMPDPFNMPYWARFIAPVVGLGTFLISLRFWMFGIQSYQSTGT
jgi:ABC-2 type transport system permease protein